MNNFNINPDTERKTISDATGLNRFLGKTYGWMAFAILLSGLVSYLCGTVYASTTFSILYGNRWMSWILIFVWFGVAMATQRQALKSPTVGIVMLSIFAALTGLTFSSIFAVYTKATITAAFVASASDFIAMSFMGLTTKKDLTNIGRQAFAALFGIIVAGFINIFLRMSIATLIISIVSVVVFSILTAFDTQKNKELYLRYGNDFSSTGLAINGALILYLDFINLFIDLLSIFGFSSDNR
ncbi:membrane protein [Philodulcilactobacillus myokoensis]|uniref:Membrane protein n=1 Tax=Philodulcilactobacillus myokoensis TaxID=2929573 RepID=A0A9W6ESG4_9LACO|nr:Bax inhibitor-1/YccA family protein [Philodulcilactobacillus myokoensis]GLB46745.1 membrane protein [Philodulcilactobacillus myokoensis]